MIEPMLSVEAAQERVLRAFTLLNAEQVPLLEATGRVLAEDVYANTTFRRMPARQWTGTQ